MTYKRQVFLKLATINTQITSVTHIAFYVILLNKYSSSLEVQASRHNVNIKQLKMMFTVQPLLQLDW